MRLPIRDIIPSRTRPLVTSAGVALAAFAALVQAPALATLASAIPHAIPLLVLGETVEDQLGHLRQCGLLAAAVALGADSHALLPSMAAGVIGAHLALFPTARILLALGRDVVEVPTFFLAGCWVFVLVMTGGPLGAPAITLLLAAAAARSLRRADRARWEHFDVLG